MKQICLSFFVLFTCISVAQETSQAELIEFVVSQTPTLIEKFEPKEKQFTVSLRTGFNDAVYTNKQALSELNGKQIIKVELVYTTYRKSEKFDQHTLNRKRLSSLFAAVPGILTQGGIDWQITGQTGCTSPEMGKDFFHGVVITYRPNPSETLSKIEVDFLKQVKEGKVPVHAYDAFLKQELKRAELAKASDTIPEKEHVFECAEFVQGERARIDFYTRNLRYPSGNNMPQTVVVEFTITKEGKVEGIQFPFIFKENPYTTEVMRFLRTTPEWRPGRLDSMITSSHVQQTIEFTERGSIIPSPLYCYSTAAPPKKEIKIPGIDYSKIRPTNASLAVVQILQRNRWENAALVVDVTGSMAQYSAQTIEYLKSELLNKTNSFQKIAFFNDGNKLADKNKKIGSTGGIFISDVTSVDDVLANMIKVMEAGDGGDIPENNIEALLKMQDSCSTCSSLVMIADNYATPRDLSLLMKVTKPVHIIVCSNSSVLNECYLTIAYRTKGSVHFNGKDITNIHTFEDGATVQVLKETYVLTNGRFYRKRK